MEGQLKDVRFTVYGLPTPQGSKTIIRPGVVVEAGTSASRAAKRTWRNEVAHAAAIERDALPGPMAGPISAELRFRFPSVKNVWRKADRDRGWRLKTTRPDIDKLVRSALDSLTSAGLIVDDSNIVDLHVTKIETADWTGVDIILKELSP
jgi:Holliday junction resolvase RusA-like endonuclease